MSLLTRLQQWHRINRATRDAARPHDKILNGEMVPVPGYPSWTELLKQDRR